MLDPFYPGPRAPRRERRVSEVPPRGQRESGPSQQEVVDETFSDLARVANKASVLAEASAAVAAAFSIPVAAGAERVRAAVRRKDQGSADGSFITFDLFKDAFEALERRRNAVRLSDFEDLSGDPLADDRSIRLWMARTDDPSLGQQQALMMVSGLMVLFTLNHMLGPYKGADVQQAVAAKVPPGTEVGPLVSQTLVGLAYQLLVAGLEDAIVEDFLRRSGAESAFSLSIPDIMDRARAREPDEMQGLAGRAMGEGDYEMILEYAYGFLNRTHEPGYEAWLAYGDARAIRQEAMTRHRSAPLYSGRHALRISLGGSSSAASTEAEDALRNAILDSIVPADVEYMCALKDHANRLDGTLDVIGQVMASRYGQDALCCIGQFLAKQDLEWISRVRQILSIFLGVQGSIRQVDFNRVVAGLVHFLDARIREELVDLIQKVVNKVADPVLDRLENEYSEDDWDILFECPLLRDLVELLLHSIQMIGRSLTDIVAGLSIEWEAQFGSPARDRWQVVHTRRKVRVLLDVLDQVVQALESGILCAGEDGAFDERSLRDFVEGLPNTHAISIRPEDVTAYFSDSRGIETPGTLDGTIAGTIPPVDDPVIRVPPRGPGDRESDFRRCRDLFQAILDGKDD